MKHLSVLLFIAVLMLSTGAANAAPAYKMQRLLLGTSSAGGSYYTIGAGWSNIINKATKKIDITCEVTGGPTSNAMLIDKNEMDLGLLTAWLGGEAFTGTGWAKKHGPYTTFLSMFPTHSSYLYIYTLKKNSDINTIYDFAGKHISVGGAGSTSDKAGRVVLDVLGIKPSNITQLPSGAQINSLKDGTIDAVFGVSGAPAPWMLDLETTHDVKRIELSDDDFAKIIKEYPFWSTDDIAANTYKNQPEPYKVVSFWNFIVVKKDIPDDVVYDLVKTTYEHYDDVLGISKSAVGFNNANLPKMTVPLHPGALRYYKEIGLNIPENMIAK